LKIGDCKKIDVKKKQKLKANVWGKDILYVSISFLAQNLQINGNGRAPPKYINWVLSLEKD